MNLLGIAIQIYRKSPLHPHATKHLAALLSAIRKERDVTRRINSLSMTLNTGQFIDAQILATGCFEPETTKVVKRLATPGMTTVDIGANIGYFTLILAKCVGPNGRVIAFEPSDWTFGRLRANISQNDLGWVEPIRAAIGVDSVNEITAQLPCGYRLDGRDTATLQTFPMLRLDDYVKEHGVEKIDLIKSDTDGHEADVVRGAMKTLERDKPILVLEAACKYKNAELEEMFSLLGKLGYRIHDDSGNPLDDPINTAIRAPGGTMNIVAQIRS